MSSLLFFWSILVIINTKYSKVTSNNSTKLNSTINEYNASHKAEQQIPRLFEPSSNRTSSHPITSPLSTSTGNEGCNINIPLFKNCYLCLQKVNDSNAIHLPICRQECGAIYHFQCIRLWRQKIRQNPTNQMLINSHLCPYCLDQIRNNRRVSRQIPQHPDERHYRCCAQFMMGLTVIFVLLVIISETSKS